MQCTTNSKAAVLNEWLPRAKGSVMLSVGRVEKKTKPGPYVLRCTHTKLDSSIKPGVGMPARIGARTVIPVGSSVSTANPFPHQDSWHRVLLLAG